jgi:hypothetical protein
MCLEIEMHAGRYVDPRLTISSCDGVYLCLSCTDTDSNYIGFDMQVHF